MAIEPSLIIYSCKYCDWVWPGYKVTIAEIILWIDIAEAKIVKLMDISFPVSSFCSYRWAINGLNPRYLISWIRQSLKCLYRALGL